MPTVGKIIAKTNGIPLNQVVKNMNSHGEKWMNANGSLTKAGNDTYMQVKKILGVKQNTSVADIINTRKNDANKIMETMDYVLSYLDKLPKIFKRCFIKNK